MVASDPGERIDEFRNPPAVDVSQEGSRLTSLSSNHRWTWWTEAWELFKDHPFRGVGAGLELESLAKSEVELLECDVLVFDNELSPSQQRNWEELAGMTVADRHEIILDIFGARAQSREARIQVDLARMEYSLPRLTRAN